MASICQCQSAKKRRCISLSVRRSLNDGLKHCARHACCSFYRFSFSVRISLQFFSPMPVDSLHPAQTATDAEQCSPQRSRSMNRTDIIPMARIALTGIFSIFSLAAAEFCTEGGEGGVEFQQSLLQHAAHVSKDEDRISICETVKTPDESPLAASMNHGKFYIIAMSDDTAVNPYSKRYFEFFNYRTNLQGGDEHRSLYFTNWWMESDDPSSKWVFEDGSRNITDPKSLIAMATKDAICLERHCKYSPWHVELWKGFPLFINWSCSGFYVGHEVLWAGGPSDPELIPYAWSLIKVPRIELEILSRPCSSVNSFKICKFPSPVPKSIQIRSNTRRVVEGLSITTSLRSQLARTICHVLGDRAVISVMVLAITRLVPVTPIMMILIIVLAMSAIVVVMSVARGLSAMQPNSVKHTVSQRGITGFGRFKRALRMFGHVM